MKAKVNLDKHAVSFDDAAMVLADELADRFHVEECDDAHSMEEDRWITTSSHPFDRTIVLRIVWTFRTKGGATVTALSAPDLRRAGKGSSMKTRSRAGEREPKPKPRTVQKSAGELVSPPERALARLRKAMEGPVDTSEIPEGRPGRTMRARRSPDGRRIAPPRSAIREAILRELGRRQITRYELWKRARVYGPTLSESAVYEFLRGERQIGIEYVEALLAAVGLEVRRRHAAA